MKAIIVSGTPGTGKTRFAKKYAKEHNYKYIDVNEIIKKENLCEAFDKKRHCMVVDEQKLVKKLIDLIKKSKEKQKLVIDSHLSHYLPKRYVEKCFICKCDLKKLEQRLKRRSYSKEKIRENLDCEIFDVCFVEALEKGHRVEVVKN